METIRQLQEQFIGKLSAIIDGQAQGRIKTALMRMATPEIDFAPRAPKATKSPKPGRVLHGKYIGALRGLSTARQKAVKRMRATKGPRAALRLARSWR